MSFEEFFKQHAGEISGWAALIAYFFYKEVWPLVSQKWVPAQIREREKERAARLAAEEDERDFKRSQEEKQTNAWEAIARNSEAQTALMQAINTKLDNHDNYTRDAVSSMFQYVASKEGKVVEKATTPR